MENVVFLVLDSLRKDKLGVYNEDIEFTENIDNFAEDAAVFENAIAQSSWTLPSHASMFTGMYPWEHEATQKNLELDVEKNLLAEKFSEEGYDTGCFSVNGFLNDHSGLVAGFDQVENLAFTGMTGNLEERLAKFGERWTAGDESKVKKIASRIGDRFFHYQSSESRETENVLERGKEFVQESDRFFLFMNLMDPHEPYYPPEKYREKHTSKQSICQNPSEFYSGRTDPDFEEIHRHYDASVDYMDDQIGEFFQFLKDEEKWEETVVVLVSDHGQMLGEEGFYGHQYSVHKKLVSVPLIVKGAEESNQQIELRELYDLLPKWADSENPQSGMEIAKGRYEFPEMMVNRIPKDRRSELYRKYTFVQTEEKKVVKAERESGEKNFTGIDLGTGEEEAPQEDLKEEMPEQSSNEGKSIDEKEEEVKKKLEALGYG